MKFSLKHMNTPRRWRPLTASSQMQKRFFRSTNGWLRRSKTSIN
ncbi:hypothetical protein [Rubritalea tangerina]